MAQCKYCTKYIDWAQRASGAWTPLETVYTEYSELPKGTVIFLDGPEGFVTVGERERPDADELIGRLPHRCTGRPPTGLKPNRKPYSKWGQYSKVSGRPRSRQLELPSTGTGTKAA